MIRADLPEPRGLFDPPARWRAITEHVVPRLRTYPSINVWLPSCGDGLGAWTMARILDEHGLIVRSRVWATDVAEEGLERAREGVLDPASMHASIELHRAAGGAGDLSSDLEMLDEAGARLRPSWRDRVVFAQHSVSTDASFNEFHFIVTGGLLRELPPASRPRVLELLSDSLCRFGLIALSPGERLDGVPGFEPFGPRESQAGLYWKVI